MDQEAARLVAERNDKLKASEANKYEFSILYRGRGECVVEGDDVELVFSINGFVLNDEGRKAFVEYMKTHTNTLLLSKGRSIEFKDNYVHVWVQTSDTCSIKDQKMDLVVIVCRFLGFTYTADYTPGPVYKARFDEGPLGTGIRYILWHRIAYHTVANYATSTDYDTVLTFVMKKGSEPYSCYLRYAHKKINMIESTIKTTYLCGIGRYYQDHIVEEFFDPNAKESNFLLYHESVRKNVGKIYDVVQ